MTFEFFITDSWFYFSYLMWKQECYGKYFSVFSWICGRQIFFPFIRCKKNFRNFDKIHHIGKQEDSSFCVQVSFHFFAKKKLWLHRYCLEKKPIKPHHIYYVLIGNDKYISWIQSSNNERQIFGYVLYIEWVGITNWIMNMLQISIHSND